jgi:hypothetical protein
MLFTSEIIAKSEGEFLNTRPWMRLWMVFEHKKSLRLEAFAFNFGGLDGTA